MTNETNIFFPTSAKELKARGWDSLDVILFTGDAYIDHPSFGVAVIARVLETLNLKIGIVPQPNWQDDLRDFKKLGKPNLYFGVTAGNMDSMVNHYTSTKRLRSDDAYTAGGEAGKRPDYATIVYSQILKKLFPDSPVIIGGIEASMRRFAHYDYWSDKIKPSILYESNADLLIYGMAEKSILEFTKRLLKGEKFEDIKDVNQIVYKTTDTINLDNKNYYLLNSFNECQSNKVKYAENFKIIETESNKVNSKILLQKTDKYIIVSNPQYPNYSQSEIDFPYELPYSRLPHPRYNGKKPIPAFDMIKNSVNIHRGCFGGCSFCTISMHQGKFILSRSEKSILNELEILSKNKDFKGHITDLGGPSANMYKMEGIDFEQCKNCSRNSCIFPNICKNLNTNHIELINLYKKAKQISNIKKITIGSGIRYDIFTKDNNGLEYFKQIVINHTSGRLKVAPEHTSDSVLKIMRKPNFDTFIKIKKDFDFICKSSSLNQQLIPYFISGHPACKNEHMAELAFETKKMNYKLEQVQDFTPTPMTLSTVIYYTGINPYTKEKIYTAKTKNEKDYQKKFIFWYLNENKTLLINEFKKINKPELINIFFGKKH